MTSIFEYFAIFLIIFEFFLNISEHFIIFWNILEYSGNQLCF